MSNQNTMIQKQLTAVTSLALSLTHLVIAAEGHVTRVAEHVLALSPDKAGVLALLSDIEQAQASLSELKALAEAVQRQMQAAG